MARIALGILSLALLLGGSGCTWTETRAEYPPRVLNGHPAQQHDHSHAE